jgi:hypothetical protein
LTGTSEGPATNEKGSPKSGRIDPGMDPPIFAWEPNDLVAFESVKAAERFLEPEHGDVGTLWDSKGQQLRFRLHKPHWWSPTVGADAWPLEPVDEKPQPAALREALVTALVFDGEDGEQLTRLPMSSLVDKAAERFRAPRRRWGTLSVGTSGQQESEGDLRNFYQSRWHRGVAQVLGSLISLFGVLLIIGGVVAAAEGESTVFEVVIWSIWLPLGLWIFARGVVMGVGVDGKGVTMRNDFRTYRYEWNEVESFSAEYRPPRLGSRAVYGFINLRDGRSRRIDAIRGKPGMGLDRFGDAWIIEQLNSELERRQAR